MGKNESASVAAADSRKRRLTLRQLVRTEIKPAGAGEMELMPVMGANCRSICLVALQEDVKVRLEWRRLESLVADLFARACIR